MKENTIFVIKFPKEFNLSKDSILSCTKPTYVNGDWDYIKIIFNDDKNKPSTKSLYNIAMINNDKVNLSDDPIFSIDMIVYDSTATKIIENWKIYVAFVETISFGSLGKYDNPFIILKPTDCILQ